MRWGPYSELTSHLLEWLVFRNLPQPVWRRATLFRVLLALSLWQAPIPCGHQHTASAECLAKHLARFHAGEQATDRLGWHWHLTLPDEGLPVSGNSVPSESGGPSRSTLSDSLPVAHVEWGTEAWGEWSWTTPVSEITAEAALVRLPSRDCYAEFLEPHVPQQVNCRLSC